MNYLVSILKIAVLTIEIVYRLLGGLHAQRLHIGIGAHECRTHILRHRFGVAADIEIGATVEPVDEVVALVPDAVLHIELLRCVAREGEVHARERAILQGILPFELIEEIVGELAVAKELSHNEHIKEAS